MRTAIALAALAMLAACGQKSALEPVAGNSLPPAPYGAEVQPTADELLALDPEAAAHVVVGHGGPLRVIAGQLLGLAPDRWLSLDFACGQATRLDIHAWGVALKWFNR